ncbi:MAG: Rrf2 family transcriptional regulator [Parvularculaceae bacterium]
MALSARFALAVHVLAVMAADRDAPQSSETLAKSAGTNPVVIRRLMQRLGAAGLTTARIGKGGGAQLARGPKKITLADIYRAVEPPGLLPVDAGGGPAVAAALAPVASAAEDAFLAALAGVTLKQIVRGLPAEIAAPDAAAKSAA